MEANSMDPLESVNALITGWRDNNRLLIRSHVTHDFKIEGVFTIPLSLEAYLQLAETFHRAFSDLQQHLTDIRIEGDSIHAHLHVSGTHTGPLANLIVTLPAISPTGKSFAINDIPIEYVIVNNKVARVIGNDVAQQKCLSLYEQLGVLLPS
jgi:predicted ester cyclase